MEMTMPRTEHDTTIDAGLFTKGQAPVPLTGVSIEAEISGVCARVAVAQSYVNREATPIEAVYVFPLDEGAAVCAFEAIVDDTVVVGEVKEREQAFRMYDDAMERGDGGFLLDEERPDVFQASVGNLPPGREALLKLTYVTELSVADGALRFSIPTTIAPRYAPVDDRTGVGRPDSETLNPPKAWSVPYGLNISVRVAMPGGITRIDSPSHPVSVGMSGQVATVTLSQREVPLDRDFVLNVEAAGLDVPQAWIERGDDGARAVAIAFAPDLGQTQSASEVIFLVDRSGSMAGTSIEEVRNALQLCLRSMIPGCRFNIVGFGSRYETLFPASREYDDASLKIASDHVASMEADLGGTEILPALTLVLDQERHKQLTRQVVVLTDGQVTNTDAVIGLVRQHAADTRVFTFGIGAGASHHLVRGVARAGGGSAELIYPGERIEPKVIRLFGRLLSPTLADVRVEWDGLAVTQIPTVVPPAFAMGRVVIYGFVRGDIDEGRLKTDPAKATLTAIGPGGPVRFDVPVDLSRATAGRTVATLAARARIRELEESPEWTMSRGSRQRDRKTSAVRQEIVELSTRYGVISRETSFVAIERRDTPVLGDVQLRRIPIALTAGWGGLQDTVLRGLHHAPAMLSVRMALPHVAPAAHGEVRAVQRMQVADGVPAREDMWSMTVSGPAGPRQKKTSATPPTGLHALVALQHADGSWDLTSELAAIIGCELGDLESAIAGASGARADARRAWATALALVWLSEHARDAQNKWQLLAAKARRWLDRVTLVPPGGGRWTEMAVKELVVRN
jgi:vault protein inter-alpha-trypsin-like protein/VWA domain-containing protein